LVSAYDSWATKLAGFATTMQQLGVPLYGLSVQNEPDFVAQSYASCIYSAAQMNAFIAVLGPKLAKLNPRPKLIAAEPDVWSHLWGGPDDYGDAILKDATATQYVDVLATHDYEHKPTAHAQASKPIWETEVSGIQGTGNCPAVCYGPNATIDNGILVAQWIFDAIAIGSASAWHYWWILPSNNDNQGLFLQNGSITKRFFTLGNYARFVRPGFVRVDVAGPIPSGVQLVAFRSPQDQSLAIVAINTNASPTMLPLFVAGPSWPSTITPWVTSASDDLAMKTSVTASLGHATITLDGSSVTTLVGKP
jgi:glucuronoarabinoxylan endo-1,4-beta-xylanase